MSPSSPLLRALLLAALLAGLAACSSEPGVTVLPDTSQGPGGSQPTAPMESSSVDSEENNEIPADARLELVTPAQLTLQQETSIDLVVRVLGGDDAPIRGARVSYDVPSDQTANLRGSTLSARSAITDDEGLAQVQLTAGDAQTLFRIDVSVRNRDDIEGDTFVVRVASKDSADYVIQALYDGPRVLEQVRLALYDGDPRDCYAADGTPLITETFSDEFPDIEVTRGVRLGREIEEYRHVVDLSDPPLTMVLAFARIGENQVAFGCAEAPDFEPGTEKLIEVPMRDLYPSIAGRYDIDMELSVYEIIPEGIRSVLDLVLDFISNPARAILNLLEEVAGVSVPQNLRATVENLLDSVLDQILPQWVNDLRQVASEVERVFREFEFLGYLQVVSEADFNGRLDGDNRLVLDGVVVRFTLPGDTEPTIFEGDFTRISGFEPIEGTWQGRMRIGDLSNDGYEHALQIELFPLTIRYGQILVFVLEDIIFRQVLGINGGFEGLLRQLLDPTCASIRDAIGGFIGDAIYGACTSAVSGLAATLRNSLLTLEGDTANFFELQTPNANPCTLFDDTDDFFISRLGDPISESVRERIRDMQTELRRSNLPAARRAEIRDELNAIDSRCRWLGLVNWVPQSGNPQPVSGRFTSDL